MKSPTGSSIVYNDQRNPRDITTPIFRPATIQQAWISLTPSQHPPDTHSTPPPTFDLSHHYPANTPTRQPPLSHHTAPHSSLPHPPIINNTSFFTFGIAHGGARRKGHIRNIDFIFKSIGRLIPLYPLAGPFRHRIFRIWAPGVLFSSSHLRCCAF